MKRRINLLFISIFFLFVLSTVYAQESLPGVWAGYVRINSTIAASGINVSAILNNASAWVSNTTIGGVEYAADVPSGYYSLAVPGSTSDKVNFKVCGVSVSLPSQDWSVGTHYNGTSPNFNLSVSTLADGQSCVYACACSGGYCNSGTCASSAPSSGSSGGSSSGGGGGGGGAAPGTTVTTLATVTTLPQVTTTVTTTLPPPVTVTETVSEIKPEEPAVIETKNSDEIKIEKIEIEVFNQVNNVEVTITRTFEQPSNVAISASTSSDEKVYTYLKVEKTNIEDKDIKSVKIKFKVEKSWLSDNNINPASVILKRYENGVWNELSTNKMSEDGNFVYYESISPGLSVFAIAAKQLPSTTTTSKPLETTTTLPQQQQKQKNVYLIIVVLVVIASIVFVIFHQHKERRKELHHKPFS